MFDGISDNMYSLVKLGIYGAINAAHITKMGYYLIKYISEPYTLQKDQTKDGKVGKAGELVFKAVYLGIVKAKTIFYWKQHVTNHSVIISTHTVFNPCL